MKCVKKFNPREFDVKIILPSTGEQSKQEYKGGKLYLDPIENYQDTVVIHSSSFEKLFGEPKYKYFQRKCNLSRRLPVVKVTYKDMSIYRRVELLSIASLTSDCAALTSKSLGELTRTIKDENDKEKADRPNDKSKVIIEKGAWFPYYWQHPNNATRISFRMGILSIIVGIISIFITLKDPICKLLCKICELICEYI